MIPYTRDNGVSPVIAVLLILAITVVVAGIVAVVATGMTGDLQNGKQVGLIVKPA
ncbi:MAG: type IV pilin, partial [Methanocalculaceae archaeon]|nr:type IV pilin [Methanocalculaceae archaeon]